MKRQSRVVEVTPAVTEESGGGGGVGGGGGSGRGSRARCSKSRAGSGRKGFRKGSIRGRRRDGWGGSGQ